MGLEAPQGRSGRCRVEMNLFPLPRIEPRPSSLYPVTVPTYVRLKYIMRIEMEYSKFSLHHGLGYAAVLFMSSVTTTCVLYRTRFYEMFYSQYSKVQKSSNSVYHSTVLQHSLLQFAGTECRYKYYVFGHYPSSSLDLTTPSSVFLKHNISETGFCFRLEVKPTQLGPIDRASPYLRINRTVFR
jgi:hypothetical protein